MKKLTYSRFILLFLPFMSQSQAQQTLPPTPASFGCAATEMMQSRPDLLLKQQQLEEYILAKKSVADAVKPGLLPYILPVVVHIIHENGAENISDAQVFAAVEHLNQAFAHEGYYAQQGDGANTQIQFCLARRDPDGQLTNGITRTESALTEIVLEADDQNLKDINRWDSKNYVNVWVVRSITSQSSGPGVVGYAYLASAHGEPYDGLVCEARYFGLNPSEDGVFIHEIGHYLNLYHTFEGGCPNANCQTSGDRVCDTPPDRATHTSCLYNSCHTDADDPSANNPFTSDVDDATENFMDYSPFPCYRAFTGGQGERMRLTIENIRNSLLLSQGCNDPCPAPITAAFSAAATEIATGETLVFTNQSLLATGYAWYINGNLESTSTNFIFQFLGEGQFEIVLKAFNDDPNCVGIAKDTIIVKCGAVAAFSINASELTAGETLHCTNNSVGATTYSWTINGFPLGASTDLDYTFNNPGFYTITLQVNNEFCNSNSSKSIYVYANSPVCDSVQGRHYAFETPPYYNYFITPAYSPDGGLYMYSYNYPKGVVTRFDPQGIKLWQNAVDVPYNGVEDICTLADGGAIFANDYDHTVLKINADGTLAWAKSVTLPSSVEFNSINLGDGALMYARAVEVDGITLLNYLYLYKFLSDGTLAWSHKYKFDVDVEFTWENTAKNDNGFWLPGFTPNGYTHRGGLIIRFDNNGNIMFCKHYKLEDDDEVAIFAVSVNNNNECVASGAEKLALGGFKARQFLFKADPTGTPVWARKFVPVLNYQYGDLQKVITRPTGGYLQMLDFSFTGRKWAAWSETGNLEFVEEITEPGFLADILQYNGRMTGFFKKDHDAKDCFLLNLAPDGKPNLCSSLNISDRQNVGFNMVASDLPYTEVAYTPVIKPITLTTSPFTPLNQVPFCTTPTQCTEFCDNGRDDDEDGYVDCFDTDCPCFDSDTACTISQAQMPISGKIKWQSKDRAVFPFSTPLIGNLNPQVDKIPEIVTYSFGRDSIFIFRGDGLNKDNPVIFVPVGLQNIDGIAPVLADINSDGVPELIIEIDGKIAVYTNYKEDQSPPFQLWLESSDTIFKPQGKIAVADFDADGIAEIYVGKQIFGFDFSNPALPRLTKKLEGTGHSGAYNAFSTGYSGHSTAADLLSTTDCNGDPDCAGLELAAGGNIYSIDLDLTDGDGLEIKIQRNLNSMVQGQIYNDGYTQVADVNLDGQPDIVVNSGRKIGAVYSSGIYVWDKNGLVSYLQNPQSFVPPWQPLTIANVYDDKKAGFAQDFPEIITLHAEPDRLVALNLNAQSQNPDDPFWWRVPTDVHAGYNGVTAFDFDLDGFDEIVTQGDSALSIVYGGSLPLPAGVNPNTRTISQITNNSFSRNTFPVIADLDNDGSAEIAYTYTVVIGSWLKVMQLRVIESANLPWPDARPVWNQFNYYGVNINDDLSVPKTQQKHWLEMGGLGSGKRPFNTCRSQVASLNPLQINKIKVPDGSLVIDSSHCQTDTFELFLNLCNLGSATLPSGTPIAFYNGDPTSTAALLLFPPILLADLVEKGVCKNITLNIPATYNATIFAVINDDGSLPRPFNLSTNFPSTTQPECQYVNNMASFSIQNQTPTLDLGPDISLCKNSVIELSANPNFQKYRWQDGSESPSFTAFTPGKYWVDAYDACGFRLSDTVNIVLNSTATLELPEVVVICAGESVELSVAGFSNYSWFPADSVSCADCSWVTVWPKQSITLMLTASEGDCFVSDSIYIQVNPNPPALGLQVENGDCDTPASIASNLELSSFGFFWSNGSAENVIFPTLSGTYTVTITSPEGCSALDSAEVVLLVPDLSISFQTMLIPCTGGTGLITGNGQGGSGQYNFDWSTGALTPSIEVVFPGNYMVTLTDPSTGCTITDTVSIVTRGEIELEGATFPVSCFGYLDGTAQVLPLDGTSPYTWQWIGGQTDSLLTGLAAGMYSVTITDAIGCTGTLDMVITEPHPLSALVQATNLLLCPDESTLMATLVDGGAPPYAFLWSNGLADSLLTATTAGYYAVTVTDANACSAMASILVETELVINILLDSLGHASGPTNADGSVFVEISGGLDPFSFLWSNGSTTQNLQSVIPGSYTLTVTDGGGCTQTFATELDFVLTTGQLSAFGWDAFLLPNPVQQGAAAQLIVESSILQEIDVQLFDAIGRLLWKEKLELNGDNRFQQIIQAPAAAGIYFVMLTNGRELRCLKWTVVD